jgi:hypothetical protein
VVDAATAHMVALDRAPELDIETFIISSPTPFYRTEAAELKHDAVAVIGHHFPDAPALWPKASRLCHGFEANTLNHVSRSTTIVFVKRAARSLSATPSFGCPE